MAEKEKALKHDSLTPFDPLKILAEWQKSGFGAVAWLKPEALESMMDISSELAQFVAARIKADVETQHAIFHCKDARKLQEIQLEFLQKTFDQYAGEIAKLTNMSGDMLTTNAKKVVS